MAFDPTWKQKNKSEKSQIEINSYFVPLRAKQFGREVANLTERKIHIPMYNNGLTGSKKT